MKSMIVFSVLATLSLPKANQEKYIFTYSFFPHFFTYYVKKKIYFNLHHFVIFIDGSFAGKNWVVEDTHNKKKNKGLKIMSISTGTDLYISIGRC